MIDCEIGVRFIVPMFGHGATDAPEIRPASIRGQLHQYFRLLGGSIDQERRVFGGVRQRRGGFATHDQTLASRIVVRVKDVHGNRTNKPTLPHKQGGRAAPRAALGADASFTLCICERLGGIADNGDRELFMRALKAWLLTGTLGFRSTRAAGSFSWEWQDFPPPETIEAYRRVCGEIMGSAPVRFDILDKEYLEPEPARCLVSDSLGGPDNRSESENDLKKLRYPLGCIKPSRKTSPLKYRLVSCADKCWILALWDAREQVTGNGESDLRGIIELLAERKPALGTLLKASALYQWAADGRKG